jgi:predicted  nucleic acid-binding Zn-ribbon protein
VESIKSLLLVQDRDIRTLRLQRLKTEIPERIKAVDLEVQESTTALEVNKSSYRKLEAECKTLELDIQGFEEKIRKWTDQRAQIQTNREYQALTSEIEEARHRIQELEDQILERMEALEVLREGVLRTDEQIAECRRDGEDRKQKLRQQLDNIDEELANNRREREEFSRAIPEDFMLLYERIFRSKRDIAVVGIENGICQGCHLRVTPQVAVDAQTPDRIARCENCGRIVYII